MCSVQAEEEDLLKGEKGMEVFVEILGAVADLALGFLEGWMLSHVFTKENESEENREDIGDEE